jgi:hypothetical protein
MLYYNRFVGRMQKWCCIGWIVANIGRDSWAVWLDLHTGEGRLRRRVD